MSVTLIINNTPFDYPEQGEQAPWGEAATGWAKEVTTVLNSINGPYDILESSANILNNQTTFQPIPGFVFDGTLVRSFEVVGNVYRTNGTIEKSESFSINGLSTGSSWVITQEGFGDSGVIFDLDSSTGQMRYKSDNLIGQTSGLIKFKATAISQV
jgi:hypothetical protein